MGLILLLFLLGIAFLAIEVIIPGGVVGTIGALLMFGGCVLAFTRFDATTGFLTVAAAVVITVIALAVEFWWLPKTKMGRRAFLTAEISGRSSVGHGDSQDLIGKTAEALTMLSPTGYVRIDGQRYEAFSQLGQIAAGSLLTVTGVDHFRLIVAPILTPKS